MENKAAVPAMGTTDNPALLPPGTAAPAKGEEKPAAPAPAPAPAPAEKPAP